MSKEENRDGPLLDEPKEFRCAAATDAVALARSLAAATKKGQKVIVVVLGNEAIGQATKAIAILNGFTASRAQLWCVLPSMEDRPMPDKHTGETRMITATLLRLVLYPF